MEKKFGPMMQMAFVVEDFDNDGIENYFDFDDDNRNAVRGFRSLCSRGADEVGKRTYALDSRVRVPSVRSLCHAATLSYSYFHHLRYAAAKCSAIL